MPDKNYKYSLDKSSKKYECPSCGHKRFVRYVDNETGQYMADEFGRCDRENECQYHLKPTGEINEFIDKPKALIEVAFPNGNTHEQFEKTDSNFHTFCYSLGITEEFLREMVVGRSAEYTAFGILNQESKTLNTKFISYNQDGNRNRDKYPFYMKPPEGKRYLRCLYGLHIFDNTIDTIIVESEKTAVIGKFFYPSYNWLATGGSQGAKSEHIEPLYGHKGRIIYLSDNDKAGSENKSIRNLLRLNETSKNVSIVNPFKSYGDGFDVADWIVKNQPKITGDLVNDLGIELPKNEIDPIQHIIETRILDFNNPIPEPIPVLSVKGGTLSTAGNITVITGHSKTGKSGALGAIMAGAMVDTLSIDTLGIDVTFNKDGKVLIYIDTEQSRYNFDRAYRNIIRRSHLHSPPEWFKPIWLSGIGPRELLKYTKGLAEYFENEYGGVYAFVIDGIGDYVVSVNDDEESNKIVEEFRTMSEEYDCPIITVIHFNPGSSKERGHIGSQLQRKAESVIEVSKDEFGVSKLNYKLLRNAGDIPEIKFEYNKDKNYHTLLGYDSPGIKEEEEQENLKAEAESYFFDKPRLTTKELIQIISEERLLSSRSRAMDIIQKMVKSNIIARVSRGVYKLDSNV